MDDRVILPMNSRKHAREVLKRIDEQGLHDKDVNVIPQIVKRPEGGYGIQVSQWDRRIMDTWRSYCEQEQD
jgi:hypothetical protein